MTEIVSRFGTTPERAEIVRGLLDYRDALRRAGIVEGTQWLDGSFVENCEQTRQRPPDDLDVVTIANRPSRYAPDWPAFVRANFGLFDPHAAKASYRCDAYFIDLGKKPELIVADVAYWLGLFSHQRVTALWKGMLAVPLNSDDAVARLLL
jgi:hypothetical protein